MAYPGPWIQDADFTTAGSGGSAWRVDRALHDEEPGPVTAAGMLATIEGAVTSDTRVMSTSPRGVTGQWNDEDWVLDDSQPVNYDADRLVKEYQAGVGAEKEATTPSLPPDAIGVELEHDLNTVEQAVLTLYVGSHNADTSGGGDQNTGAGSPISSAEWEASVINTTDWYSWDSNGDYIIFTSTWLGHGLTGPSFEGLLFDTALTPVGDADAQAPYGTYDVTDLLTGRTIDGASVDGLFSLSLVVDVDALPSIIFGGFPGNTILFGHDIYGEMEYTIRPARYRFIYENEPYIRDYPTDHAHDRSFASPARGWPPSKKNRRWSEHR